MTYKELKNKKLGIEALLRDLGDNPNIFEKLRKDLQAELGLLVQLMENKKAAVRPS